jgi:FkbM family methyltransferase
MRKLVVGTLIGIVLSFGMLYVRRLWLERERQAGEVVETPADTEAAKLHRLYGPTKHSQFFEEWIVRDFFHDQHGGTFVDVGAADYTAGSNTYYLERALEWSGVAIDAQERYRAGYERYRPHTRYFTFLVDDHSNQKSAFYASRIQPFVSSTTANFTRTFTKDVVSHEVTTVTLNDLLASLHIDTFDFLSLDIELAEPKALAGFDIERYQPKLACVEAHPQVRQQILDYFSQRHYAVVGKYLRVDAVNLWFMPVGTKTADFP